MIYKGNGTKYNRLICTRGKDYLLIYNHTGRSMDVDLSNVSGSKKNIWVMDTRNGNLEYLGEYKDGRHTLTTNAESVLIAIDTGKDYITIQQQTILYSEANKDKDLTE